MLNTNIEFEKHIRDHLEYSDGELYWKDRVGKGKRFNGKQAGWYDDKGYKRICVKGRDTPAHRIIFFIHNGYWPKYVDHINRNKGDNRIENLRECTNSQNLFNGSSTNNRSKYGRGVSWHKKKRKYIARVRFNYKTINVGHFDCPEEARKAAAHVRKEYYGDFNYDY